MNRRRFVQSLGALSLVSQLPSVAAEATPLAAPLKAKRLSPGDTVALVSPASAKFNSVDLQIAKDSLEALGFKVKNGSPILERDGYLAGEDKARAEDINKAFADAFAAAVDAIRGGWGSARMLPYLDYD